MISTNMLGLAAVIGSALLFSVDGKEVDKRVVSVVVGTLYVCYPYDTI